MFWRIARFLKPTFYSLIGFAILVGAANLVRLRQADSAGFAGQQSLGLEQLDLSKVTLPRPELQPEEVVALQLAGLAAARADGVGILQCYCFASPANRAVTGPLERFGRMVRLEPYLSMGSPRALLIGRPEIEGNIARLLVTFIDERSQMRAFAFVLARQSDRPFKNCWMTEAVVPALSPAPPAPPSPSPKA